MKWLARNYWYVFLLPGLALLTGALVTGCRAVSFRISAEHAAGQVIGNTYISRSDRGGSYHPQVAFATPDGRIHRFTGSMGSSPASFDDGDQVAVLYDPSEPKTACIDTIAQQYGVPLICAGMGLPIALAGGLPLWSRNKRERLARWLEGNGRLIQASIMETSTSRPYYISANWTNPDTRKIYRFYSHDVLYDPAPYLPPEFVTVSIDPDNPRRYRMDTSFLPR